MSKNFGNAGTDLRSSIAEMARNLCIRETKPVPGHHTSIEAYISCRLIPLDKSPGVRPIGIGEVLRRIIGKSIISVIKPDILISTGSLQLAAGLPSGCEAAAHAMEEIFQEEGTDAILLIDAANAFNSLNRQVLLHNIRYLCPPMATYIRNCYGTPSRLFITGGQEILSSEGTTQGDPFAMPAYTVGIAPLLHMINTEEDDKGNFRDVHTVKHAAYADDLGGAGELEYLRTWWNRVLHFGPLLGYFPNASKSWLVVKEDKVDAAKEIFADTEINITSEGRAYLGSFIGSDDSREKYAKELVEKWCGQLKILSTIAKSEPQAAYAAFVSGFQHKLTYHIHTLPKLGQLLKPLDDVLTLHFIPALTEGQHCSQGERKLLSFPSRLGGLAIPIFSEISEREYEFSKTATEQMSKNIKSQTAEYSFDTRAHVSTKNAIKNARKAKQHLILSHLKTRMNKDQVRANEIAQMKGASNWLTSLPLKTENYVLNKREFHDAIRMRYRWPLKYLPTTCACGKQFSVDHGLSCLKGGFIHQRHDEIRDLFGQLASEDLARRRD